MGMERCIFCGVEATRLCDAAIALVDGGEVVKQPGKPSYSVTSMEAMLSTSYTCDAPVCLGCVKTIGFICGGEMDTIDRCIGCCESGHHGDTLMTPAQIDKERRRMHARYRRKAMKSGAYA